MALKAGSLEASQIPAKREQGWVCLTATGLNLIGRVGHKLFTDGRDDWQTYADALARIDWRKSAEIWRGNIIKSNKVMTQQVPLREGYLKVLVEIGLRVPDPQTQSLQLDTVELGVTA